MRHSRNNKFLKLPNLISVLPAAATLVAGVLLLGSAHAGERRFTYVYEATTAPKNEVEVENWVTWETQKEDGLRGNTFAFRHELEYGVTDHFQLSVYAADWKVVDNVAGGEKGAQAIYEDSAVEAVYNLTNPVTDWIGSAVYGEVRLGDQSLGLESKVILQKDFGPLVLAYNASVEAEWEGDRFGNFHETTGSIEQTLGASYQITPNFLVGGEFLHEMELAEWQSPADQIVYVGPNASFRYDRFFVTATAMIQATAITDEPDFQLRAIFGFHF
jgi:hypothetical protein